MEVYVVTQPEDGWDCVVGVCLSPESLKKFIEEITENILSEDFFEELKKVLEENSLFRYESYLIHTKTAQ